MSKTYHQMSPEKSFLVYDGSLRRERPGNWANYANIFDNDTFIIKLGTNVVTHKDPRRTAHVMHCIAEDVRELKDKYGKKILLVSSGAIGLGRKLRLRIGEKIPEGEKSSVKQKRLDAIYGQDELYRLWTNHFYPQRTDEILITHQDVRQKTNLFSRLNRNLENGVVSIVNEDDKKSLEEIEGKDKLFWDNDSLSSLLAQQIRHDRKGVVLIILTNQDGLYTRESYENGEKHVIRVVKNADGLEKQVADDKSPQGRGGMLTKVLALRDAAEKGVHGIIANGMYCNFDGAYQRDEEDATRDYKIIYDILIGKFVGTRFMPQK